MLLSRCFPDRHSRTLAPVPRCRWPLTSVPLLLLGCGGPFPQSTLHPRSDFARAADTVFTDIFWWAVLVFVVVETVLLFVLVRFRHREGRAAPRPTHGHTLLEIAWTLAPAVILVFVAVPTGRTIFATSGEAPPDALKVQVTGHQRWCEYKYLNLGFSTAIEKTLSYGLTRQSAITTYSV